MKKIGILALQGSVTEHRKSLEQLADVEVLEVKDVSSLRLADGLILPGGESTTIGKLLNEFGIMEPLRKRIADGLPVWGTCAGMILLAKNITNQDYTHLSLMDISVRRNAYGNQLDSFIDRTVIEDISPDPLPLVFIRAPWIENVGEGVNVLLVHRDKIVAAREKNMFVTSFHPELTKDLSFHRYFAGMISK
jgi:5'-phosphate synthase pdxT subunit